MMEKNMPTVEGKLERHDESLQLVSEPVGQDDDIGSCISFLMKSAIWQR
jgi:hypothetical protein